MFRSKSKKLCADLVVGQGMASSEADCAARCAAESTCSYFSFGDNSWCRLTKTCDQIQTDKDQDHSFVVYRKLTIDVQPYANFHFRSVTVDPEAHLDIADWYAEIETNSSYGGLDGCLYAPNTCFGSTKCSHKNWIPHEQELNRVIQKVVLDQDDVHLVARSRFAYALEACQNLCCRSSSPLSLQDRVALCGQKFSICNAKYSDHRYEENSEDRMFEELDLLNDRCMVDMTVLGALVITSRVGGPDIQMKWGRRQGNCKNLLEDVSVQSGVNASNIALHGSSMTFAEMHTVIDHFKRMGFTEEEATALMGAHSFAKQHKYAGVWAPRRGGHGFCNTLRGGGVDEFLGANDTWGDGNFWDRTPDRLDNDYFKLMVEADGLEDENNCCGSETKYGCSTRWEEGDTPDLTQGCRHQWCMRSPTPWMPLNAEEKDWAMLSTQISLDQWNASKFPEAAPSPIRLVRLAADQVLVHNPKTKKAVKAFADSESAFHQAYAAAFSKMVSLGYQPGELKTCSQAPKGDFQLYDGIGRRLCADPHLWQGHVASRTDCEDKCAAESRCGYYSFWVDTAWCRLTTTCCSRGAQNANIEIHKKMGHPGLPVWKVRAGPGRFACQETPGSVIVHLHGSSCQADCQQRCAQDHECKYATFWWSGGNWCSLMRSCDKLIGHHAQTITVYEKPQPESSPEARKKRARSRWQGARHSPQSRHARSQQGRPEKRWPSAAKR